MTADGHFAMDASGLGRVASQVGILESRPCVGHCGNKEAVCLDEIFA